MRMVRIAAGLALLTIAAGPGAAAPGESKAYDPNRQICKTKPVVGSRLKRIRECATAQQWEDMKQQERSGLMRKQYNGAPGCQGCDGTRDSPN